MSHPELDRIDDWVSSLQADASSLVLHLLGCATCAERVRLRLGLPAFVRTSEPIDYSSMWPRVLERAQRADALGQRSRERADDLLAELLSLPLDRALARIRSDRRFARRALAERALASLREDDPAAAETLARIALAVAEVLPTRAATVAARMGLVSSARCQLAEALRRQGQLERAEAEINQAGISWDLAVDVLDRAHYCRVLAALRRDRGRLDEALALFQRAVELYEELGEADRAATTWLAIGDLHLELLSTERARQAFESALATPGPVSPAHAARAVRGLAYAHLQGEGPERALRLLDEAAAIYRWPADSREAFTLLALRGRIELAAGHTGLAKEALRAAFEGLVHRGNSLEAARAAAFLALLCLREPGTRPERLDLARALDNLSQAGLPLEVQMALAGLRDGLRHGSLTPRRLRTLLATIDRHRAIDPTEVLPPGTIVH